MTKANLLQVTPFLHVPDLAEALDFFCRRLGFAVGFEGDGYAYIEREGAAFRLLQLPPPDCRDPGQTPMHDGFAYYIDVRDVDALVAELSPRLADLPPERVHGPVDQAYGQREFMVRGPDDGLIVFGQGLQADPG